MSSRAMERKRRSWSHIDLLISSAPAPGRLVGWLCGGLGWGLGEYYHTHLHIDTGYHLDTDEARKTLHPPMYRPGHAYQHGNAPSREFTVMS